MTTSVVLGAGGFIGGHLVRRLIDDGHRVRAVDIKHQDDWLQIHDEADLWDRTDAREHMELRLPLREADQVFNLAADMGGMGFIERNRAACSMTVLATATVLQSCLQADVGRVFYSSSACVYPAFMQRFTDVVTPLAESDAVPADPEAGYGWEKLFGEKLAQYMTEDYGMETRVARYHNIYGTHTTWRGGREKAPAAVCRKIAEVELGLAPPVIEIWGDGTQVRSFCWVDDCVEGTMRLMASDFGEPLNIGSHESITVTGLYELVADIAGVHPEWTYNLDAPQGVPGRNSDNRLCREVLGWEPSVPLVEGMTNLYAWVRDRVDERAKTRE